MSRRLAIEARLPAEVALPVTISPHLLAVMLFVACGALDISTVLAPCDSTASAKASRRSAMRWWPRLTSARLISPVSFCSSIGLEAKEFQPGVVRHGASYPALVAATDAEKYGGADNHITGPGFLPTNATYFQPAFSIGEWPEFHNAGNAESLGGGSHVFDLPHGNRGEPRITDDAGDLVSG